MRKEFLFMTRKPAIFLRPGEGERLDYLDGDVSVVLASGDATGGAFSAVEHHLAPGVAGPPKHYHERMCDSFYVLEGTLSLWVEDRWEAAGPGSFACFPPGGVHTFANKSDQAVRVLNVNSPGGWDEVLRAIVNHAQRSGPVGSAAVGEMSAQRDMIVVE
jgi:quercetin dioxygenase-like cupin family protein